MSRHTAEMQQVFDEADCIYTEGQVSEAMDRLASEVTTTIGDQDPLILCIMNGGLVVAGQLLPRLGFPLQLDYAQLSRYRGNTTGGDLEWKVHPQARLSGRTVLIVDDILDEGDTMAALAEACRTEGAERVWTLALVEKHHDRKSQPGFEADFIGLQTPDRYLFGYGMDYQGYWRNAPGIYAVRGL